MDGASLHGVRRSGDNKFLGVFLRARNDRWTWGLLIPRDQRFVEVVDGQEAGGDRFAEGFDRRLA